MLVPPSTATLDTPVRRRQLVRLEQLWFSSARTCVVGNVAVLNLAFTKTVACRYTFDAWAAVREVAAGYQEEVLPRTAALGHDRFQFCIPLPNAPSHLDQTAEFCIRYTVGHHEAWDNNGGANFTLHFKRCLAAPMPQPSAEPRRRAPAGYLLALRNPDLHLLRRYDAMQHLTVPVRRTPLVEAVNGGQPHNGCAAIGSQSANVAYGLMV